MVLSPVLLVIFQGYLTKSFYDMIIGDEKIVFFQVKTAA